MVKRDELTQFIYQTLGTDLIAQAAKIDTVPNSVQIKGKETVNKVALGVSASIEFFEQAIKEEVDYCIFHHGLFINGYVINGRLDPYEHQLRLIFKNDLTVAGFHYVLDAHPTLGNNAQIIEKLGAVNTNQPYFDGWGYVAEFKNPLAPEELANKLSTICQHDVFAVYAGPKTIKRIGVCSGGARPRGSQILEIIDNQVDAHITGEISESGPYMAEEGRYHYFACGHYATEVFGVQALAAVIKKHFGNKLEVEFLDIPSSL